MKRLLAAGAAFGLALTAAPAVADDHMYQWTPAQEAMYDGWPADRRATYDAWPMEAQAYYWTLNADQQRGWWMLTNEQRVQIVGLTPEQRAAAWTSVMNQMNNASTTGMTARTTASANPGGMAPRFVSRAVVQTTPSGYQATTNGADLPVCSANQQDGCINSWEKNRTGTRPLDYWPGRPASEMD